MRLSPMRYKDYTWPYNPRVYSIDYERKMAVNKVPFGYYHLQNLGRTRRVMRGEGEFMGEDAYREFGKLATVFYGDEPGLLIHPLWQASNAYFVELKLEQEPRPDYIKYSFVFWEADSHHSGTVELMNQPAPSGGGASGGGTSAGTKTHVVGKGDTLWGIASRYGLSLEGLLDMNPQIKNPNLIYPGDEVTVG